MTTSIACITNSIPTCTRAHIPTFTRAHIPKLFSCLAEIQHFIRQYNS